MRLSIQTGQLISHAEEMQSQASNLNDLQQEVKRVRAMLSAYTTLPDYIYSQLDSFCGSLEEYADNTKKASTALKEAAYDYEKTEAGLTGEDVDFNIGSQSAQGSDSEADSSESSGTSIESIIWWGSISTVNFVLLPPSPPAIEVVDWASIRRAFFKAIENLFSTQRDSAYYIQKKLDIFRQYMETLNSLSTSLHHIVKPVKKVTSKSGGYSTTWNMPSIIEAFYNPTIKIRAW